MVMAPALLIPFAEAAGLTVAGLGAIEIGKKVKDFVDNNPDATMEILTMLVPGGQGLSTLFKDKDTSSTKDIVLGELGKDKGNYSSPDADGNYSSKRGRIIKALEEAGKIKKGPDKDYDASKKYKDYKKFYEKADGGRVGYNLGGRATTQDYTNALKRVSAGTTYQQQTQARDYAKNEAANELRSAMQGGNLDSFLKGAGAGMYESYRGLYPDIGIQANYTKMGESRLLDALAQKKLQFTSYAPPPPKPTYRSVSPEAQALNMDQSTYQDIISSGKDPRQYYMDFNNRLLTEAQNPNLLTYGQVMAGPGLGMAGLQTSGGTPPTQAQIDAATQKMLNNPEGYQDFDEAVKYYSSTDPYMGFKEEVRDVVGGRDTGYMSGQDYYDTKVLGLDGQGIAEKYGLQYADGGRVGMFMGGSPLEGPALNIYNSMNSYGFTDQEIAQALDEKQLYPGSMTLGMKEEVVTPGKVKSILPTSDGEGGGGITNITNSNPNFDYEFAALGNLANPNNVALTEEEQKTLDFQKGKDGLMSFAKGLGYAINPLGFFAKKGYDLYKNKVRDAQYRKEERLRMEEFQKQKAADLAFEEEKLSNTAFQNAMANPTAFYASLNDGAGATSTASSRSEAGTDDTPGTPFANGGLATMFVRRG